MIFALVGNPVSHSKSPKFFNNLFREKGLDNIYKTFCIDSIEEVLPIIENDKDLYGLNITSPFKEDVIKYLDYLSPEAKEIGAVNVIKINRLDNRVEMYGYNTDCLALYDILSHLQLSNNKALILGSAGAAKATAWALKRHSIDYLFVSRNKSNKEKTILYEDINKNLLSKVGLIINATPLGMDGISYPNIPYIFLNHNHICFDLIYEPEQTPFLNKALEKGAKIMNGYDMLIRQAIYSWDIWSKRLTF